MFIITIYNIRDSYQWIYVELLMKCNAFFKSHTLNCVIPISHLHLYPDLLSKVNMEETFCYKYTGFYVSPSAAGGKQPL